MVAADFVSGQAVALECALGTDEADDLVAVILVDTHAPVTKGEVEGIDGLSSAEGRHDPRVAEEVEGPSRTIAGAMCLRPQPPLPFINDRQITPTDGDADRRRFAVPKREISRHKAAEYIVLALV